MTYRAAAQDVAQGGTDLDTLIACLVLVMRGEDFDGVGRAFDVAAFWGPMGTDVRTVPTRSAATSAKKCVLTWSTVSCRPSRPVGEDER